MIWKNVRERKGLYMGLTHFDENGKAVMVDVTDKKETAREACGPTGKHFPRFYLQ